MKIQLRDPNTIMKLSRLGSFHQSKLSFLRSFLNEFKDWEYKRDLFNLDRFGYGEAVYSFRKDKRTYSLVCFANKIKDDERSDPIPICFVFIISAVLATISQKLSSVQFVLSFK